MSDEENQCKCSCHIQLERWDRFQEAARLEKSWMNERMNWMLVPQGVLFGALAWIVKLQNETGITPTQEELMTGVAALVATLGVTLAVIGLVGATAAGRMHFLWTTKLNKIAATLPYDTTFGMKPHWPARTTAIMPAVVAIAFSLTWLTFICLYFKADDIIIIGWILAAGILTVFSGVFFITRLGNHFQNLSRLPPPKTIEAPISPKKIKAVFFDVDGVLLDSLPAHIAVCEQLNSEYSLNLTIPTDADFKTNFIRAGKEIAPMRSFFKAVGFTGDDLTNAVKWYDDNFSKKYMSGYYGGVKEMVSNLAETKTLTLGIVTSNVRNNIKASLTDVFEHFEPECIFTDDMRVSKSEAIKLGALRLGILTEEILFVGDQKRDQEAAEAVGANFLGVTYGWQFAPEDDLGFTLVHKPEEITTHIQSIIDRQ